MRERVRLVSDHHRLSNDASTIVPSADSWADLSTINVLNLFTHYILQLFRRSQGMSPLSLSLGLDRSAVTPLEQSRHVERAMHRKHACFANVPLELNSSTFGSFLNTFLSAPALNRTHP